MIPPVGTNRTDPNGAASAFRTLRPPDRLGGEELHHVHTSLEGSLDLGRRRDPRKHRYAGPSALADHRWREPGRHDEPRTGLEGDLDLVRPDHGASTHEQVRVLGQDAQRVQRSLGAQRHLRTGQAPGRQRRAEARRARHVLDDDDGKDAEGFESFED